MAEVCKPSHRGLIPASPVSTVDRVMTNVHEPYETTDLRRRAASISGESARSLMSIAPRCRLRSDQAQTSALDSRRSSAFVFGVFPTWSSAPRHRSPRDLRFVGLGPANPRGGEAVHAPLRGIRCRHSR